MLHMVINYRRFITICEKFIHCTIFASFTFAEMDECVNVVYGTIEVKLSFYYEQHRTFIIKTWQSCKLYFYRFRLLTRNFTSLTNEHVGMRKKSISFLIESSIFVVAMLIASSVAMEIVGKKMPLIHLTFCPRAVKFACNKNERQKKNQFGSKILIGFQEIT